MSALNLLLGYNSDSDDNEQVEAELPKTNKKLLPLPESISSWKGVTHHEVVISNPSEHEGRVRTFEHERGNWATLTYIKYNPSETLLTWMNDTKNNLQIEGLTLQEEFHISLTRTLVLKYHWIDSFVESLKKMLSHVKQFVIKLEDLQVYCNENKSRTFIGIRCVDEDNKLKYLTNQMDKLLEDYKLEPFYEEASWHISFMWCVGNKKKELDSMLPTLSTSLNDLLCEHFEERSFPVEKVHCKIGNRTYKFNLI